LPNWVIASSKPPAKVRVQALDTNARATNATEWSRANMRYIDGAVSLCGVTLVRFHERCRANIGLCLVDSTACFETTNDDGFVLAQKPIARWHWGSIVEKWRIAQYNWIAAFCAHDYFKLTLWNAT
jgi:hypothetical protein